MKADIRLGKSWSGKTETHKHKGVKMNAGEQSFNHMPFAIDYINELLAQIA